MGWKHFTEIEAWQLSMKLKTELDVVLCRPPACNDRKFCDDVRDTAGSPPKNIAEGFEKYGHREFARFLLIAKGSLGEIQNDLIDARNRKFVTEEEFKKLWELSTQAKSATVGLWRYLRRSDGKAPGT